VNSLYIFSQKIKFNDLKYYYQLLLYIIIILKNYFKLYTSNTETIEIIFRVLAFTYQIHYFSVKYK